MPTAQSPPEPDASSAPAQAKMDLQEESGLQNKNLPRVRSVISVHGIPVAATINSLIKCGLVGYGCPLQPATSVPLMMGKTSHARGLNDSVIHMTRCSSVPWSYGCTAR